MNPDKKPPRRHAPITAFAVIDGSLHIGGVPLARLAARVGCTPFFAYDRRAISARVALLRDHLPNTVHLSYAIKANPMPAVVQYLAGLVDGLDVASAGELRVALDTPMPPDRISFAGPGKTADELAQAVAAGITINLESAGEMARAAAAGEALGLTPRVAVRVNPDFELRGSGMRMGGGAKPFGVDAERVPAMLAEMAGMALAFQGFHIFTGSQNLRADSIREAQEKTVALALTLADKAPCPPAFINMGGGFGIPYFPGDAPLDLAAVGAGLAEILPPVAACLPETRMVIELGRYLVGEAGIYVCRVVDRKVSRGQVFLITDGGLHHQLAASGNFGQVLRRNYPIAIGTEMTPAETETVTVVGRLCTPLDLLGDKVALAPAEIGDLVVIFQSGAYGPTASPADFLSHPRAVEVLL